MATLKVLLPYNFASHDRKALAFVAQTFGRQSDVEVHLFFAHSSTPEVGAAGSPVMDRMKSSVTYVSKMISDQELSLEKTRKDLVDKGFADHQVQTIFRPRTRDLAGEILELLGEGAFDVVVLNRKPGKITRFFTGSVFDKLAASSTDAVICLVT
jgi:hypothetical protein